MRQAGTREWRRVLPLALIVSAGVYAAVALFLEAPPGANGLQRDDAAAGGVSTPQQGAPPADAQAGIDRYYTSREVDLPARAVYRPPLVIPEQAYVSRLAGTVRARIFIDARGDVERVHILHAAPVRGMFEAAARDALRRMRFEPARISGRAVKSQKVVDVVFNPRADTTDAQR